MNRKDTIIVAVFLNVIILSVLFVLAVNIEETGTNETIEIARDIVLEDKLPARLNQAQVLLAEGDDAFQENKYDLILGDLDSTENEPLTRDEEWAMFAQRPETSQETKTFVEMRSDNIVEIIVKKGDSLDRIARANATTVQSIRTLNALKNDHLKIGQTLNVDVGSAKKSVDQRPKVTSQPVAPRNQNASAPKEVIYYTLKSGDSPWKVAKQFHVNMDDLLRLNQLDEDKARNLKVGDKMRVQ